VVGLRLRRSPDHHGFDSIGYSCCAVLAGGDLGEQLDLDPLGGFMAARPLPGTWRLIQRLRR
jgi:hypothetical protein